MKHVTDVLRVRRHREMFLLPSYNNVIDIRANLAKNGKNRKLVQRSRNSLVSVRLQSIEPLSSYKHKKH
jgi:hypothetical protein